MRIGIDVRMIFPFPTGIGNYRKSLIESLLKLDNKNEYFLIGNEDSIFNPVYLDKSIESESLTSMWKNIYERNPNFTFQKIKSKANHPLQHILLPFELSKLKLDIFWTNPWGAVLIMPCKYILTIHDLIYHRYPAFGSFKSRLFEIFLEKSVARKADAVVTISEFAKQDIIKFLGVDFKKIYNASEGASSEYRVISDEKFLNLVARKYNLAIDNKSSADHPYFVYLGNQRPHKNLVGLLKSFELFMSKKVDEDVLLVIIGGVDAKGRDADSQRIQDQLQKMKSKDKVLLLGKVFDNNEVSAIFNRAVALVHPSLHEGFGLTPLEAMKCGCPVISSNVTSVPEVVGEAGILIDPNNEKQISDAMADIYYDVKLRKELKEKSIERAKLFSWEKTAKMLLDIFNKKL